MNKEDWQVHWHIALSATVRVCPRVLRTPSASLLSQEEGKEEKEKKTGRKKDKFGVGYG